MNKIKHMGIAACIASAILLSGQAVAASVTVAGNTVSFTFDSALTGLFGTPTVLGDSLYFTPTSFKALSNGNGYVVTSQTFNIAVNANAGYEVAGASLTEAGDYFNINTNFALKEGVAVGGMLILRDLEAPFASPASSAISAAAPFTATTDLSTFATTNWTAAAHVGVPLAWGGTDGIVSGVNVTLQNILVAGTFNVASSAFIEKKFAGIEIFTTPIPEPETYALFLAGLGLVGFIARRRSGARV
jgi:hypothetical protein